MGTTAFEFVNKTIAQLRKDNPEKLKEKGVRIKTATSKHCGECDAPRGTEHVAGCNFGGR
jgi:hypothetical protein